MIVVPAIDILRGRTVRLEQGAFAAATAYDADPFAAAERWTRAGAQALHVVDLDGARRGRPVNLEPVSRIAREAGVPVQVGGGLRTPEAVREVLAAGAHRAVVGTAAHADPGLLASLAEEFGSCLVVSLDARHGRLATDGWTRDSGTPIEAVLERCLETGIRRFVYSSIERDGTMSGPDLEGVRALARAADGASILYSGGIASVGDLRALAALGQPNLSGVIVGKALYERRFSVREAIEACTTSG